MISITYELLIIEDMGNTTAMTAGSAEALAGELTIMLGFGNWSVTVECVEAGDAEGTGGIQGEEDDGNDWQLTLIAAYYDAVIKKHITPVM